MTYYNALGQAMLESGWPADDPAYSLHGPDSGGAMLYAPSNYPAGVAANGGHNTIIGSDGDNSYWIGPTDTVVVPDGLAGIKTIYAWNAVVMPDNVNNLTFYGGGTWGVGNALGNLIVMGGNDDNYMDGGAGNDVLVGGLGHNHYGVSTGAGDDTIYNFHPSNDTVRMTGSSFTSFAQVQAAMTQVGADVVMQIDPTETLTFRDITVGDFQAKDFLLPLDRAQLGGLTFDDEFNSLQLFDAATGAGHWQTSFYGPPQPGSTDGLWNYQNSSTQEQEVYTSAAFSGTADHPLGYDPFSIDNGVVSITARQFTAPDSYYAWGQPYSSGMLNTKGVFMQQYGYFEMKAELPTALGTWPAFWLSEDPYEGDAEADILEHLASTPNTTYVRAYDWGGPTGVTVNYANQYTSNPSGYHTYGMLWTASTTTFYIDDLAVMQIATPQSWQKPMYLIVNLAVGGWGGDVDLSALPAQMNIDYVRVYGLSDNTQTTEYLAPGAVPSTPAVSPSVSVADPTYVAPDGVTGITLTGTSAQTVTGNNAGDTFVSNNNANHLIGGTGDDTFHIGRAGDTVTGGGGHDLFVFDENPWWGGHITDFAAGDVIDLTPTLARAGYTGSDPVGAGFVKIASNAAGDALVYIDPNGTGGASNGWWLATTVDGVGGAKLTVQGDTIVEIAPAVSPPVSTADAAYVAPAGVTSITLTGTSAQTVTGNDAGDTFVSNNNANHLIGGTGDDTFYIGRAGDTVTGGGGHDLFVFDENPWWGGVITDFAAGDEINLSPTLNKAGYTGSDPVAAGFVKLMDDASGNAEVLIDPNGTGGAANGWWLAVTLDGLSSAALHVDGGWITA